MPFRAIVFVSVLTMLLLLTEKLHAGEIKCPSIKDTHLSDHSKERDFNMGASPKIKLKFTQEFGLVDFDVSKLKGREIKDAWISVRHAGGSRWKLNKGADLKWLTLSTVSSPWVEGKSGRYGLDPNGNGATFNESSYKKQNWGWPGARIYDVTMGNGNTLRSDQQLQAAGGGWYKARIDNRLVKALVAGAAHGFLIQDGSGDVVLNAYISSRESKSGPFLTVQTGATDNQAPARVSGLKVTPDENSATLTHGAVRLSFTVPKDAFAYQVTIDGKAVQRWQIPFADEAGKSQSFAIKDLEPGKSVSIEISAVDGAGNISPAAKTTARASSKITVPKLPPYPFKPRGGAPRSLGSARVWAVPELTEIDPVNGKAMHQGGADLRSKNAVWDGSTGMVRLAAAKGEIISFQLIIEGAIQNVKIDLSDLKGPGSIPKKGVKLWRNWYTANQPEYAIPLKDTVSCPMADNAVQGQTNQSVTVDYHVPVKTKAGNYKGTVTLSAGGSTVKLPLSVKVYSSTIPETVFFNPELNCYGGPGNAGSAQFKDSFRIAHYHRATINRVPYNHAGRTHSDWIPKVDGTGKVTDWSNFDNNLSGLLDGSWFKDNPRAGVPVATFYLPFYEGWPLDYRKHINAGCKLPTGGKAKEEMTKFHMKCPPMDKAMSQAYKDAFARCVSDFAAHAKEKGWTRTMFQMYQNNKGWKSKNIYCLWTLDEPYKYADWEAINFWGRLFNKGANDPESLTHEWHRQYFLKGGVAAMKRNRGTFFYRGDVSRARWQGSVSDGIMGILYGGGSRRLMTPMRERAPMILYNYGSNPHNKGDNWGSAAWCLKTYQSNRDGVLPWQSLGGEGSLKSGDRKGGGNALIINAGKYGHAVASLRVHGMRRGAQDCELIRLLQIKKGWSRLHTGALINQKMPIGGEHQVTDAASAMKFSKLKGENFLELKEGILQLLEM